MRWRSSGMPGRRTRSRDHQQRRREAPDTRKPRDCPGRPPRPVTTAPEIIRWQADPERRAARPEHRKRRGSASRPGPHRPSPSATNCGAFEQESLQSVGQRTRLPRSPRATGHTSRDRAIFWWPLLATSEGGGFKGGFTDRPGTCLDLHPRLESGPLRHIFGTARQRRPAP